jgi:hypothetical protein
MEQTKVVIEARKMHKKQVGLLAILVSIYAIITFSMLVFMPLDQLYAGMTIPQEVNAIPRWQMGVESAALIGVLYGLLGMAGLWFARKLELPGIYRPGAGWQAWLIKPMLIGLACGVFLVIGDRVFTVLSGQATSAFVHPGFPLSIFASATAGIGEEILFRSFVMGLWAFIFNLVLKKRKATHVALWIGNIIGALAFSAGHLPSVMALMGATSPADIPVWILLEGLVLNGVLGLIAGQRYMKEGLVAAVGIHFWADILWHVIFPLTGF